MKCYFITFLFFMFCIAANAMHPLSATKIDTVRRFSDTVLARISCYEDETIRYSEEALLVPDTLLVARYLLPWTFLLVRFGHRTVLVSRVIRHGQLKVFEKDGRRTIQEFSVGSRVKAEYWSSDDRLITKDEYYGKSIWIDSRPFEEETSHSFIFPSNKKRKVKSTDNF